jgi:hypothetical protein
MWNSFGANSKKLKLEEERQRQEQLIQEQLKGLELEHEMRLEKITQRGLIAKKRQETQQQQQQQQLKQQKDNNGQPKGPNEVLTEEQKKLSYVEMARMGYQELVNAIIRPPRAQYKACNYQTIHRRSSNNHFHPSKLLTDSLVVLCTVLYFSYLLLTYLLTTVCIIYH